MRPNLVLPLAGLLLLAFVGFYYATSGAAPPAATEDGLAVYFSPRGGCTEAVVDALGTAKQTVLVQAYRASTIAPTAALEPAQKT